MADKLNIYQKLTRIQNELKVPKKQWNEFSKFSYRSAEDIQEAVKPILLKYELTLRATDSLELIGDRFYIVSTIILTDGEKEIEVKAYAREQLTMKGQSEPQITGGASSYARKYALNGLFQLDDSSDPDKNPPQMNANEQRQAQAIKGRATTSKATTSKPANDARLEVLKKLFGELPEKTQLMTLDAYSIGKIEDLPVEKWGDAISGLNKRKQKNAEK